MDTLGTSVLSIIWRSEVLTCIQLLVGGTQFVHCREVVHSSECPLSEVPLVRRGYITTRKLQVLINCKVTVHVRYSKCCYYFWHHSINMKSLICS